MNLYLRLLILFIRSRFKPRLGLMDKSVLKFYVLPSDLDINMHMNNGRFNSIMDLGRVDIMLRTGFLKIMHQRKWLGVVGSIHTRFRRPLKLFQAYELQSQVIYWDDKWTWIEHKMYSPGKLKGKLKGKLICSALVQTIILKKGEHVSTEEIHQLLAFDKPSPKITDEISHLEKFEPLK